MKRLLRDITVSLIVTALAGGFGLAWTDASFAKVAGGGGAGAGGGPGAGSAAGTGGGTSSASGAAVAAAGPGGTSAALRPRVPLADDGTSLAARRPVSGPVNQWYGLTAVPGSTVRQQAIPAVVAVQPRTGVMGAAAATADAPGGTSVAQPYPVRDATIVTTPLEPSPWRLPRR